MEAAVADRLTIVFICLHEGVKGVGLKNGISDELIDEVCLRCNKLRIPVEALSLCLECVFTQ